MQKISAKEGDGKKEKMQFGTKFVSGKIFVKWHKDDHSFHSKIIVTNEIFVKLHADVKNICSEKEQEEIVPLFSSRSSPKWGWIVSQRKAKLTRLQR